MDSEGLIVILFMVLALGLLGLAIVYGLFPESRVSRKMRAIWNKPSVVRFQKITEMVVGVVCLIFFGGVFLYWYFTESAWYPREREVQVFFKAHQLVEGEILYCGSSRSNDRKAAEAEIQTLTCEFEQEESHTLRVRFWGPIVADKPKAWKCEKNETKMICKLQ